MNKKLYFVLTSIFVLCFSVLSFSIVSNAESLSYDFIEIFGLDADSVLTQEGYALSDVYDSNYSSRFVTENSNSVTNYRDLVTNHPEYFVGSMDETLMCDEVFCWITNDATSDFGFHTFPTGSYVLFGTGGDYCVICPTDYDYVVESGYKVTGGLSVGYHSASVLKTYLTSTTMGGSSVVRTDIFTNSSTRFFISSLPIYYYNGRLNGNTNLSNISQTDINFNPTTSSGSSGSHESSSNNLVLEDADFTFKHSQYFAPYSESINTGSIYPNGSISFSFTPNEYQKSHPEEFNVVLGFSFDYDVTYRYIANADNPPFYLTSSVLNNQKTCKLSFSYLDNNDRYLTIPLSQFTSNGGVYSLSFQDVFDKLYSTEYGLSQVLRISKEIDSISYNKFNINCLACIVDTNEQRSGNYAEWYNPINQKGYTTDKSALTNDNPYVENDDYNEAYDNLFTPGTAGTDGDNSNNVGGGSSASASTGSITINNNVNNNNALSSELSSGGFLSTLLTLLANNQVSTSESIASMVDTNGFGEVFNSTLSAVPSSIWTVLIVTFSACVGITVIAIIIRILVLIFFY